SGSIATSSRGNLGEITPLDWLPHPGYEFGSIVADPLNPKVSYAGGPGGGIIKTSYPSGQWIDVSPSIDTKLALRKVGNQPLVFSQRNPRELYAGFQCLMATADGGKRWRALSPDLTLKPGEKPPAAPAAPVRRGRRGPAGAPATGQPAAKPAEPPASPADGPANPQPGQTPRSDDDDDADRVPYDDGDKDADEEAEQQLGPRYAIESIAPSSVDANIIWAGTNNGLIKLTRDHGATWTDISIRDLPNATRADISAIDASHMDAGTAYAAVDCHASADYKPYIYRTRDFGKSWTPIVAGLPESEAGGSFVRVVRADTVRGGLIFAGTESSVYYSIDDGDHWQSLALNLPVTSYRDMVVKGNDLVVGTYGRGFWILDDISPLRQMSPSAGMGPAVLLKPAEAVRVRRNVNGDTPFPPEVPHADNPPNGAIVYYYLGGKASGEITLEVRDERGSVIRRYSSAPIPPSTDPPPPVPDFWVEKPSPLPKEPGLNRMCWDLRCESPGAFSHSYGINANPGQTPASPEGPLALPGRYTLTLTVEGKQYTQSVTVKNDPRSPASVADLRDQFALQLALYQCTRDAWNAYHQIAGVRASISAILRATPPAEVETAARALDTKLLAVGGTTGFGVRFGGGGGGGFGGAAAGPRQPTFATMNGQAVRQLNTLDSGDMAPSEAMRKAAAAVCADMDKAKKSWALLRSKDLAQFDALLAKYNLKPIGGQTAALAPERAVAR
ncbi:MAG TPA: sialidase family protein, partial [Chthonomonadaceae bacterium]|nr:sialidase family protein [Chthonomonadaceae bacterium]